MIRGLHLEKFPLDVHVLISCCLSFLLHPCCVILIMTIDLFPVLCYSVFINYIYKRVFLSITGYKQLQPEQYKFLSLIFVCSD